MANIWFTSDSHFGHKRIMEFCPHSRAGFTNVDEMDEAIIQKWNDTVHPGDIVYHTGDVTFHNKTAKSEELIGRLNGNIHLILGNHDQKIRDGVISRGLFADVKHYKEVTIDKIRVCLFHFPMHEWHQCHRGSFHLYGHVHATYKTHHGKSMNIGVDTRDDLGLYSWDEVKAFMADKPIITHHDQEERA